MQRRLYILLILAFVGSCGVASAQRDVPTIEALGERNEKGATSTITLHADARKAVNAYYDNVQAQKSIKGYRVRIYAGNHQNARKSAESAIGAFRSRFDEPIYFTYDNPYFYVACGNFLTNEEAIIFLAGVKEYFPKALIVSSDIPVETIARRVAEGRNISTEQQTEEVIGTILEDIIESQNALVPDSLLSERDRFVRDSLAIVHYQQAQQRKAREYDELARTMEILPEDSLPFEIPLDGEFYAVTLFPDSLEQLMNDPRMQKILSDKEENPIEQDKSRGKSGEWEYLNQPF